MNYWTVSRNKLIQFLWKVIWQYVSKVLKRVILVDEIFLLLGIYSKQKNKQLRYTKIFIEALLEMLKKLEKTKKMIK